jgi:hypothetical protein
MYEDTIQELITRAGKCAEPMKQMAKAMNSISIPQELLDAMELK